MNKCCTQQYPTLHYIYTIPDVTVVTLYFNNNNNNNNTNNNIFLKLTIIQIIISYNTYMTNHV